MGVGGNFWDMLKPYARNQGFDFLRHKRVAIDLSYWIVQQETAIKTRVLNPHIRLTFFRTVNLFSKFGTFPVFVVDGTPSPLKSNARILRFFRASGIDPSSLPVAEEGVSVERNQFFSKCVQECVELLELLGMPVLKAKGEAEALCGQLNREGYVDACITADSDAFLYGAKCVIKRINPNSQEPFECYLMSDIEAGLGLKRKHLIAISLLVGSDHDLNGVQGIGLETACRFVKNVAEDEILNRLQEIGRGNTLSSPASSDKNTTKIKSPHCSVCGHPGSKRAHLKYTCECCSLNTSGGCIQKPAGFICDCSSCDMFEKEKKQKQHETWYLKVCQKIASQQNFPNDEIIEMYLSNNHGYFTDGGLHLSWKSPNTETLIDYLAYNQHWEHSYIRQKLLPVLSSIFLRDMASNLRKDGLLCGQYEFDSIHRVKVRLGHQFYVVNWKKASKAMENLITTYPEEPEIQGYLEKDIDILDEPDVTEVLIDNGSLFLLTDENTELVGAAFPEKVQLFLQQKEKKEVESRRKKNKSLGTPEQSEVPKSRSVQLNITEFYCSSKLRCQEKHAENLAENSERGSGMSKGKRNLCNQNIPKSVRRRLLLG